MKKEFKAKVEVTYLAMFLVQASLLNLFKIGGATPNLVIIYLVLGIYFGIGTFTEHLICAAAYGLVYDLFFMPYVGGYTLALVLTALFIEELAKNALSGSLFISQTLVTVAFIIHSIINWIFAKAGGISKSLVYMLRQSSGPFIYTFVLAFILYLFQTRKKKEKRHKHIFW